MAIEIRHQKGDSPFEMQATNENGASLIIDGTPKIGGKNKGMSPMELVATAVGGCSSIDVLMMLKKRNVAVEDYGVKVEYKREAVKSHSEFKEMIIHFSVKADVSGEIFKKLVALSIEKYCSVSKLVEKTAAISFTTEVVSCI